MKSNLIILLLIVSILICSFLFGCSPSKEMSTESIPVVSNFDLNKYLGTWYEIARLPHSFENGLDSVTATYSLREDGMIKVVNKGYNTLKREWKEAIGKARFKEDALGAYLEVSFFWIFYGDYKVIELDTINYTYSMITSSSKEYLWILCRTSQMDETKYKELIDEANGWGFDISQIYKVAH